MRIRRSRRPGPDAEPVRPARLHDPQEQGCRRDDGSCRQEPKAGPTGSRRPGPAPSASWRTGSGDVDDAEEPVLVLGLLEQAGGCRASRSPRGCRSARRCTGGRRRITRATSRPAGQRRAASRGGAGACARPLGGPGRASRTASGRPSLAQTAVDEVGDEERGGHGEREARHDGRPRRPGRSIAGDASRWQSQMAVSMNRVAATWAKCQESRPARVPGDGAEGEDERQDHARAALHAHAPQDQRDDARR